VGSREKARVIPVSASDPRLKGRIIAIEKTGETRMRDGETWEKCIFTLEVTRFSKRTPKEVVPNWLKGKKVKLVRYCIYDWHYRLGVEKTLDARETDSLLRKQPSSTISW
jgi:hypothetical protein